MEDVELRDDPAKGKFLLKGEAKVSEVTVVSVPQTTLEVHDLEFNLKKVLAHHSKRQVGVEELKRVIALLRKKGNIRGNLTPTPVLSAGGKLTPIESYVKPGKQRLLYSSRVEQAVISVGRGKRQTKELRNTVIVSGETGEKGTVRLSSNLPGVSDMHPTGKSLSPVDRMFALTPPISELMRSGRGSPGHIREKHRDRITIRQIFPNLHLNRSKDIQSAYLSTQPSRRSPLKSLKSMRRVL